MNEYSNSNLFRQGKSRRSELMEIAALTFGILSIATCTCFYLAIPCGALAVILALLSRGGDMICGAKAYTGLGLGLGGLCLTVVLYALSLFVMIAAYGGFSNFTTEMRQYDFSDERHFYDTYEQMLEDINEHLNDLLSTNQRYPGQQQKSILEDPVTEDQN